MKVDMKGTLWLLVLCFYTFCQGYPNYHIGTGIFDITGPASEVGMLGYAQLVQMTQGIHSRLWSRAFIVHDNNKRIVMVCVDLAMITSSIKIVVLEKLHELYGNVYTHENVMITATHTHSGPGGYAWHAMYGSNSFGFNQQNFDAIVEGILQSIVHAHVSLTPGHIRLGQGNLEGVSINRSPTAYNANPMEERKQYELNVDTEMFQLMFQNNKSEDIGIFNWFPVHATSMKNRNGYISGDNKGYASYLFERHMNPGFFSGQGPFVAAFAQSNEGDVSPNTLGGLCDNGGFCDVHHSTCRGWSQGCNSKGPGKDEFESTMITGSKQFEKAFEIFKHSDTKVMGPLDYAHLWVDMENTVISPLFIEHNQSYVTCIGALGDSMAAGTIDGPGEFNFVQGTTDPNKNSAWHWLIESFFGSHGEEQMKCHAPKPILFLSGNIHWPSKWTQGVVPVQLFRLGDVWIIATPAEFTTMAGRRLISTVKDRLKLLDAWKPNSKVIITCLSNSYTHYVTTKEEYDVQRYEGASTLFGPYTLNAYQMYFTYLVDSIVLKRPLPTNKVPEDIRNETVSYFPKVIMDTAPDNIFGAMLVKAKELYHVEEAVEVKFWTGSPRNNLMTNESFLWVEYKEETQKWKPIANDADWETKYRWERHGISRSVATIQWDIPKLTAKGVYRIRHFGHYKDIYGHIHSFEGISNEFNVV